MRKILNNIFGVFKSDIKSLFSNKIIILTFIAFLLIPSLYSLVNIDACGEVYDNTKNLKIAVVNLDEGAMYDGEYLNIGNNITDELNHNENFNWVTTNYEEAMEGVDNGKYHACLVVPQNFTESVLSLTDENPNPASIHYIINSANNPVTQRMTNTAVNQINALINQAIMKTVVNSGIDGLNLIAAKLSSGSAQLNSGADQIYAGTAQLQEGADKIHKVTHIIEKYLPNTTAAEIAEQMDLFADGGIIIGNAAADGFNTASSSLSGGSAQIHSVTGKDFNALNTYLDSPVTVDKIELNPVNDYASEIAPFYLVLSMFVGAIATCVTWNCRPQIEGLKPLEVYFGKMGLFVLMAILQTTVSVIGTFILGFQINNMLLYLLFMYMIGITFMILIYTVIAVLGNIGKGVALIALVMQISTTGGLYASELLKEWAAALTPYMPMTYGIYLIRGSCLGYNTPKLLFSVAVIVGIFIASILFGLIFRTIYEGRADYFEKKLKETKLF